VPNGVIDMSMCSRGVWNSGMSCIISIPFSSIPGLGRDMLRFCFEYISPSIKVSSIIPCRLNMSADALLCSADRGGDWSAMIGSAWPKCDRGETDVGTMLGSTIGDGDRNGPLKGCGVPKSEAGIGG
jgi:hypothetical protein